MAVFYGYAKKPALRQYAKIVCWKIFPRIFVEGSSLLKKIIKHNFKKNINEHWLMFNCLKIFFVNVKSGTFRACLPIMRN